MKDATSPGGRVTRVPIDVVGDTTGDVQATLDAAVALLEPLGESRLADSRSRRRRSTA